MTNSTIILIDAVLLIVAAAVLLLAVTRNRRQNGIGLYIALCAIVAAWTLCDLMGHSSNRAARTELYYGLRTALAAFSSVVLLIFVLRYCRMDRHLGPVRPMLCVIPAITALLSLTGGLHSLMWEQFLVVRLVPLLRIVRTPGPWYWVHVFYSYLVFVATFVILLYRNRQMPRDYRRPTYHMALGVVCALALNILGATVWDDAGPDATLAGAVIVLLFVYSAVSGGDQADFLVLARQEIFEYIEDKIFILGTDRRVMDANEAGRRWLEELGVVGETPAFSDVTGHLTVADFVPQQGEMLPEGLSVYISPAPLPSVYQMREQTVFGVDGESLGLFITFTDVTRYRMLIDRMEQAMGIDPLTGLGNRYRYESRREELDLPEFLPLAVVVGDVNGLKMINDNLGHQQGDKLLQACARVLESVCGSRGQVFRIGGDEFVCLMPKTGRHTAQTLVEELEEATASIDHLAFQASVAFGVGVKEKAEQDFSEVFHSADFAMYQSKRKDRRRGPPDRRVGPHDRREPPPEPV